MRISRAAVVLAVVAAAGCAGPRTVPGSPEPLGAGRTTTSAAPTATPSRPAPVGTPTGTAVVPTSFVPYTRTDHGVTITLPVPADWSLVPTENGADLGDRSGRLLLRLEIRARTGTESARRGWELAETEFDDLPAYRRLGLTEVPGVGDSAADLTFTFERGVTRQVIDRGIAVGGAWVAIYFSAEQRLYDEMLPVFAEATQGLRITGR